MTVKIQKGIFITFEGIEGSGKSTQIKLLESFFASVGRDCVCTREPGGTELGEKLRDIVKHYNGSEGVADEAELLLFEASRVQLVRKLIEPAVNAGKIVLCDRFYDSTTAYQGYARKQDLDFLHSLNRYASCGRAPDLTFILDLPAEKGLARASDRIGGILTDRFEKEDFEFHRMIRDAFLEIARAEPGRVKLVDADRSQEEIQTEIRELVQSAFGPF